MKMIYILKCLINQLSDSELKDETLTRPTTIEVTNVIGKDYEVTIKEVYNHK